MTAAAAAPGPAAPAAAALDVPAGVRPDLVRDSLALAGRCLRVSLRTPATLVLGVFFPVVLMAVMSASFADIVAPDGTYRDYLDDVLPLFVVMGMSFGALAAGVAAHRDLHAGLDARLRTLPVAPGATVAGRILGDLPRILGSLAVVVAVGHLLGFRFTGGVPAAGGFILVGLAFGSSFTSVAVTVGLAAGSAEATGGLLNLPLTTLSFLSTGFVPADDLPGWAQPIARVNPISVAVEALRALAQGGPTTGPVLRSLAWSAAIAVVFCILALRTLHRRRAR